MQTSGRILDRLVWTRSIWLFVIALILAGCGGGRSHPMLDVAFSNHDDIVAEHRILIATSRAAAENAADVFGGARAETLTFARADVTVPRVHQSGQLDRPRRGSPRDPSRHLAARDVAIFDADTEFRAALRERLRQTDGRAMVFVHGFRTPFDASVYRMTQIVHDSRYTGTPVLFSWASSGRTIDYIYDTNSATAARDGLEKTLRELREAGAVRIDLVAHSLGNWLMMEALRQLAISSDHDITSILGDVVLASPDIDVDVFKSQLRRIGPPDKPFFVLVSRDDRALRFSSLIAGNQPRLGDFAGDKDLTRLGVTVIDVSEMESGDRLNHARFADNPMLVQLLGDRLNDPRQFDGDGDQISHRIERLSLGLGAAAQIVITTPLEVINVAVGQ